MAGVISNIVDKVNSLSNFVGPVPVQEPQQVEEQQYYAPQPHPGYTPAEYVQQIQNSSIVNQPQTDFEQAADRWRDDNALKALSADLKNREEFQHNYNDAAVNSAWGQMGFDFSQDPLYQQQHEAATMGKYDPSGVSEEVRRRIMGEDGNLKANPLEWNILGLSSQEETTPGARAVYESYFDQNPSDGERVDRGVVDPNLIDDGHGDGSRESIYMTGQQYLNYRNAGIPGRDTYYIDPNAIYSKQDEMESYGFIPYITNESSRDYFKEQADMNELNNAYKHLANARRENADFNVNYGGRQYSGRELLREAQPFMRRLNEQVNDSSRIVYDRSQASEFAVPHVPVYAVRDENTGNVQEFIGEPVSKGWLDDGSAIRFQWADGSYADFNDKDDIVASTERSYRPAADGEEDAATAWVELDPLVLQNGETIRADKAQELLGQLNNEQALDYGTLGWGRQNVENPMEHGVLPWLADMALGSVPLFWWSTSVPQAVANAQASSEGMQPGASDYVNGTYSMLSDKPTGEQRDWATAGSLALPFTERLWGNLGKSVIPGLEKRIESLSPAAQYLVGAAGEGLEEVPGNVVEELMQGYGPSEWYADEITDDEGKPIRDSQGHSLRDTETSIPQRIHNFLGDAPLSMLGGAALGGVLGAPLPGRYVQRRDDVPEVDYANNIVVPLSDEEIAYYNRNR